MVFSNHQSDFLETIVRFRSNIIYEDPFFNKIISRIFLRAAQDHFISIFVADVVVKESEQNYLKNYEEIYKEFQKIKISAKRLDLYFDDTDLFKINPKLRWQIHIRELTEKNQITVLPYKNEWLPEIVNRAICRIKPIKNNGDGFRDCLIWLTYADHINSHKTEDAIFITNNTKDFYNSEYDDLHQDLKRDINNTKVYKSIKDFFNSHKSIYDKYQDFALSSKISEEYTHDKICKLIEDKYMDVINKYCASYLEGIDSIAVDDECSISGIYEFDCVTDLKVKYEMVIECVDNEAEIGGILSVDFVAISYLYNSCRDPGEPRWIKGKSCIHNIEVNFKLLMNNNLELIDFNLEQEAGYNY